MTTSPSRQVKSALTKAFPGTKFSVTTNGSVYVSWEMDLGCPVTCDAVAAIAKPFDTHTNTANPYEDYYYFEGYRIELCPKFSEARKDWAAECVASDWNEKDAKWNKEWQLFRSEDGALSYHANKEYHHYLENGVAILFVDEDGEEPYEKTCYYERQDQEVEQSVEVKTETVSSISSDPVIVPIKIQPLQVEVFASVRYPSLNKCDQIEEYLEQTESYLQRTLITEIITLSDEDYNQFTHSFLANQDWLKDKGGTNSSYESPTAKTYEQLCSNPKELEKWRAASYLDGLLVTDGKNYVVVDPQGYDYARYVGFCEELAEEFLKLAVESIPELTAKVEEKTEPSKVKTKIFFIPEQQKPINEQQEKIDEILSSRRDRWEEKQESKTESYERLKTKHEQLSDNAYNASKNISKWIPFGQPILVGHHSETRHRRDAEKIHTYMGKSIQHQQTAEYYVEKLESLSNNSTISSDDPDAISKLEAKLAAMQHRHQFMKDVNKILSSKKLSEEQKKEYLTGLNISPNKVASLIENKKGFPSYALLNNTQNMSQVKKRLGQLKAKLAEAVKTSLETVEYPNLGFTLVRNREIDRLQLIFDGKPPEETRNLLKSHGFKWSPSNLAWQRLLNGQAESSLYRLIINLQAL